MATASLLGVILERGNVSGGENEDDEAYLDDSLHVSLLQEGYLHVALPSFPLSFTHRFGDGLWEVRNTPQRNPLLRSTRYYTIFCHLIQLSHDINDIL